MMGELGGALAYIFQPLPLFFLVLGTWLGIFVGAVPGPRLHATGPYIIGRPAAPPFRPNSGPREGSRMATMLFSPTTTRLMRHGKLPTRYGSSCRSRTDGAGGGGGASFGSSLPSNLQRTMARSAAMHS